MVKSDSNYPTVSVVTPSYNQAQFLEDTILSVLDQDYPNIEYIIVDGGSTDGSVEIIRKYAHRLASWVSESDRGQSHAINKGWRRATGQILAYLNSDDIYASKAISTAVRSLLSTPAACMVYSDAIIIDARGNRVRQVMSRPFGAKELILNDSYVPQPTAFIRREAIDTVGLLDERLHMAMDYDLWIRLALKYPALYLRNTHLAMMREHATAKSTAFLSRFPPERRRIMNKVFACSDVPQDIRGIRGRAYSFISFDQASIAAYCNRSEDVLCPLFHSVVDSPLYVATRPHDALYLTLRGLMPWWKGFSRPKAHMDA